LQVLSPAIAAIHDFEVNSDGGWLSQ